jgi:hypothetical protein
MRSINHFTPCEGYFPWSIVNIFRLTNILYRVKHSKTKKTLFFKNYFMPKKKHGP